MEPEIKLKELEIKLKELKFKVGDEIIIAATPPVWSSLLNKNDPMGEDIYPYKCTIKEIKDNSSYMAMTCGSYGWNLSSLIKNNLITKVEKNFILPRNWCIDARGLTSEEQDSVISFVERSCPYSFKKFIKTHIPHFSENIFLNILSRKDYVEITFEQFKKYVLKENMDKEIIGYKLVKPEYKQAIVDITQMGMIDYYNPNNISEGTIAYGRLKQAGVLDLWFEPVYKSKFKAGDWIYFDGNCHKAGPYLLHSVDDLYGKNIKGEIFDLSSKYYRYATEEEIEKHNSISIQNYKVIIDQDKEVVKIGCKSFTFDEVRTVAKAVKAGLTVTKDDGENILKLENLININYKQ